MKIKNAATCASCIYYNGVRRCNGVAPCELKREMKRSWDSVCEAYKKRLTIRNFDGTVSQPTDLDWAEALERLADYEDLDEQGRLVELPCKVGDKTLYYDIFDRKINEEAVDAFVIDKGGIRISLEGYPVLQTAYFRTIEEIEAELEKMKGEK